MKTKINERDDEFVIVNPLQVKQEIILKCKHCDERLMQIIVMQRPNNEQLNWEVFAHCFNCGSRSKMYKIVGQYAYSGILDGEKELTSITDVETVNDVVAFKVIRKVENAQEN